MKSLRITFIALGLAVAGSLAVAQYTGPSAAASASPSSATAPYSGPSSVPLMTVKQLIATGRDDQHARLQGRIVSHDGGKNYTFADDTGRLPVEISTKRFPPGQPIRAEQRVELSGQVDKDLMQKMEFEVDTVRLLP